MRWVEKTRSRGRWLSGVLANLCRTDEWHSRRRLTIVDHLPAPLLHAHLGLDSRPLVQVWSRGKHHDAIPARSDFNRLLLLDPVDRQGVFGVRPEDAEGCTAYISCDPRVVEACSVSLQAKTREKVTGNDSPDML